MDFLIFFTALMVIKSIFDGVSEGLHLKMFDFSFGGSAYDHTRKLTDGMEFGIPMVALLGTVYLLAPQVGLEWWSVGLFVVLGLGIRWVLRDGIQNMITGQAFFYVGTVAKIDTLVGPLGPFMVAMVKTFSAAFPFIILYKLAS